MAKQLNSKMKLCKVFHNGPIMALGGVTGPILYPCKIDLRKVINMVHQGINVVEVNPKNHKETIDLTIQNVSLTNFPDKPKYKMPEETKKVEPVVVKKEDVITAVQDNIIDKKTEEKIEETREVTYPDVAEEVSNETETVEVKEKKYEKPYKSDFHKKNKYK